ncbi:cyclic lactone autoinducer peptide [Paenibacillus tepidiphilus]|nr:cyclic lactone autoinducer peptide [Paenibacillus tepidiphilus]
MKKSISRTASKMLTSSARFFSTVLKPFAYSPQAPEELRK